ncbi:hypothetical protein GCM10009835_06320 [Planosporangium flavigriseum]
MRGTFRCQVHQQAETPKGGAERPRPKIVLFLTLTLRWNAFIDTSHFAKSHTSGLWSGFTGASGRRSRGVTAINTVVT